MPESAAEAFRAWHDFYVLIGTAAATLIGAMFVVVSIGSRFMTEERRPHVNAFMTSSVVHLSAVVLTSALVMVPALDWRGVALAFGIGGVAGILYSGIVGWRVLRGRVDWTDPIWYGLVPLAAYCAFLAAGLSVLLHAVPSIAALAIGPGLLLIAGIRNSWDMIVYFALRGRGPP
jgi:hypothetical protein